MSNQNAESLPQEKDMPRRTERRGLARRLGLSVLRSREASVAIAGLLLVVYFQSTAPAFLSPGNIGNLAGYTATTSIIAAGEVMVVIAGEIDLSAGQVYALCPFVMFTLSRRAFPSFSRFSSD